VSRENVEIVRLGYERLNGGDVEGFLELCAPDFEFRDLAALPGSGVHIGRAGFRAWWSQMTDAFDDLRFEAEEFIDAGGNRVVLVNRGVGRGKGSGADVELFFSTVSTLSNGKLVTHIAYGDHVDALKAAGLSG
jgi:ketosteroid isomerase-like protein